MERLHNALDGELTWQTRREIVEALIERIELSWIKEDGKVARVARVRYSFSPASVSGGEVNSSGRLHRQEFVEATN